MRAIPSLLVLLFIMAACGEGEKSSITIGGIVTGLSGTGLVLTNNGVDDLAIAADGSFTFEATVIAGEPYAVTVKTQPTSPTQTCVVTEGTGMSNTSVIDIVVTCMTDVFTVGGTVTGLTGSGLVLQNNGADDLAISADGTFTFPMPLASGTAFAVTVKTQPSSPTQTCTVAGGTGTIGMGNVTTVVIDCVVDRFTIGGTVSGLAGTLVLQNNGGDDITVTANGTFAFPTTVASSSTYDVTVLTQPSVPSQTCTVTMGSGTVTNADITDVTVECVTNTFNVGGTVSGLAGTGLVLQNNGGDNLAITTNGPFTFATPVASGATYAVTVLTQPSNPTQQCLVTNSAGTIGATDITDVAITCTTLTFTIGGTVTGLLGTGLVLQNNGGDDLSITADGSFTFTTPVLSGDTYEVTVLTPPASPQQHCSVSGGSGTVGGANVTSVAVNCADTPTCADLLTTASVWGITARGLDLRPYTNGTFDWIGCPDNGCTSSAFFCTDEANGIFFGTTSGTLRALIDPGNAAGDPFPTSYNSSISTGCCTAAAPRNICNAPMAANNGVGGINAADALCKAMGFASGAIVVEVSTANYCPKPHTTTADGTNWTSDWVEVNGYGQQYRCTR